MIKNTLTMLALVAVVFTAESAQAQQADYAKTGIHVGLGLGGGFERFDDEGTPVDFDHGFVVGGWLGYRLHPNFAIETQIEYGGFEAELAGFIDIDIDLVTFTTNAKAYVLTDRIQPFVLVGVGAMVVELEANAFGSSISDSESDFVARFGGGVDFWLTESISLGLASSYVFTTGDIDGFDYVSLGAALQYRF